jgi:hypothetical protein
MCWFWRREKRWYSKASPKAQALARAIYKGLMAFRMRTSGRRLRDYARDCASDRGMHFEHDVHDWVGGYPYETVSPADVDRAMTSLKLSHVRSFVAQGWAFGRNPGLFGSGCDEFVYRLP